MIMNMKQKKRKIEPRIKLNYNIYRYSGVSTKCFSYFPFSQILSKRFHLFLFHCLQELEEELQSMLDRTKVKEKDARYKSL